MLKVIKVIKTFKTGLSSFSGYNIVMNLWDKQKTILLKTTCFNVILIMGGVVTVKMFLNSDFNLIITIADILS